MRTHLAVLSIGDFTRTETTPKTRPALQPMPVRSRGIDTVDAKQRLAELFIESLAKSNDEDALPPTSTRIALHYLRSLRNLVPELAVPTISPGPDGLLGMTWDDGVRHVNIQILPTGAVEFFGDGFSQRGPWSEEHRVAQVRNEQLLNHLRMMVRGPDEARR